VRDALTSSHSSICCPPLDPGGVAMALAYTGGAADIVPGLRMRFRR